MANRPRGRLGRFFFASKIRSANELCGKMRCPGENRAHAAQFSTSFFEPCQVHSLTTPPIPLPVNCGTLLEHAHRHETAFSEKQRKHSLLDAASFLRFDRSRLSFAHPVAAVALSGRIVEVQPRFISRNDVENAFGLSSFENSKHHFAPIHTFSFCSSVSSRGTHLVQRLR